MRPLKIVVVISLSLFLIASGFAFWMYRELNQPILHSHENDYIEIPRGSTPEQIIQKLEIAGVIGRKWPLRLYIRLTDAGPKLKAGEYRFPSPISPLGVLRKLEEGEQRLGQFTVIEGSTRWDIAEAMKRLPELGLKDTSEILALMDNVTLINDLDPSAKNLEGYLYPDTYSFPPNTTPEEMIAVMVRRFRQVWEQRFEERASALNLSPAKIVTIASLIETEAKLEKERELVSSVIYNRLRLNMALGIDSTFIYAAKLAGKWKTEEPISQNDVNTVVGIDSPYNTRKYPGLPPGPVGSPGADSIDAALNPAQTDFIYYVRAPSPDGSHNFSSNENDFLRDKKKFQEWLRDQR